MGKSEEQKQQSITPYELTLIKLLGYLNRELLRCKKDLDLIEDQDFEDTKEHGFILGKDHAYSDIREKILSELNTIRFEADSPRLDA